MELYANLYPARAGNTCSASNNYFIIFLNNLLFRKENNKKVSGSRADCMHQQKRTQRETFCEFKQASIVLHSSINYCKNV